MMPYYEYVCETDGCVHQDDIIAVVKSMTDPSPRCACGQKMNKVPSVAHVRVRGGTPIHHQRGRKA